MSEVADPSSKSKQVKPRLFKKIAKSYFFTKDKQDLPKSRFYTARSGVNSLITSAQPILSIIARIRQSPNLKLIADLKKSVIHELQVYEKHSLQQGISMEQVLVGRYCLSAMLDEVMGDSALGSEWKESQLLPNKTDDEEPKEQFFNILDKLIQKPEQNIVCLELIYLLLSLGYEGKYKYYPNKSHIINQLMDELYEAIRLYRGCYQTKLLVMQNTAPPQKKKTKRLSRFTFLIVVTLILVYLGFSYVLDVSASFVVKEIKHIVSWLL